MVPAGKSIMNVGGEKFHVVFDSLTQEAFRCSESLH